MKETNEVQTGEMSGHIFFSVYKKLFKLTKISLENLNMLVQGASDFQIFLHREHIGIFYCFINVFGKENILKIL